MLGPLQLYFSLRGDLSVWNALQPKTQSDESLGLGSTQAMLISLPTLHVSNVLIRTQRTEEVNAKHIKLVKCDIFWWFDKMAVGTNKKICSRLRTSQSYEPSLHLAFPRDWLVFCLIPAPSSQPDSPPRTVWFLDSPAQLNLPFPHLKLASTWKAGWSKG